MMDKKFKPIKISETHQINLYTVMINIFKLTKIEECVRRQQMSPAFS